MIPPDRIYSYIHVSGNVSVCAVCSGWHHGRHRGNDVSKEDTAEVVISCSQQVVETREERRGSEGPFRSANSR